MSEVHPEPEHNRRATDRSMSARIAWNPTVNLAHIAATITIIAAVVSAAMWIADANKALQQYVASVDAKTAANAVRIEAILRDRETVKERLDRMNINMRRIEGKVDEINNYLRNRNGIPNK